MVVTVWQTSENLRIQSPPWWIGYRSTRVKENNGIEKSTEFKPITSNKKMCNHREKDLQRMSYWYKEARQTTEGIWIIGTTETFKAKRVRGKCPSNGSPVGDDWEAWARMRMQIGTWRDNNSSNSNQAKECTILLHDQWSPTEHPRWAVRISMHNGKLIVK